MDEEGIAKKSDIAKAFSSRLMRQRMRDHAERAAAFQSRTVVPVDGSIDAVLAGRSIDLSALGSCVECEGDVLDRIFRSVWHYFDAVVVEGLSGMQASDMLSWPDDSEELAASFLSAHMNILFDVRAIGAEDMLIFRQKKVPCVYHWSDHLEEAGLDSLIQAAPDIISIFEREGELESFGKGEGDGWTFAYKHPALGAGPIFGGLIREEDSADPDTHPRRAVAESIFKYFASRIVADVQTSQVYGLPLGSALAPSALTMSGKQVANEADVAMALQLPALEGVPLKELLRIRKDEALSFDRFRVAMRSAIKERLRGEEELSSEAIAREIREDIVEPALLEIESKLKAARKVLIRKSGASVAVTSIATVVGLMAHMPLLLPAGIAAGMTPAVHYSKYLEEVRDLEVHELYFLWRLGSVHH
ncbi:hypothetical protein AB0M43_37920 [Longispora sp. NPDC051575]|uniref:hypothetical protein n=1 Tax=Longispora sp. NPDC051575 TaxID=3154943 RepID=UPI003437419C